MSSSDDHGAESPSSSSANNAANNAANSALNNASSNSALNNASSSSSSANIPDESFVPPVISPVFHDQTITEPGFVIRNQDGLDASGGYVAYTTFDTTNPELYDPQISEKLLENVGVYNDVTDPASENARLVLEIKDYASKIQCSDFHGKGTIDDYTALFTAASRIANETKSITLDIDVAGFDEFSQAADDLSALFTSFIVKLQNVNIINDIDFLRSISAALHKIWNLSEVFGRFKQTILSTTTIQFPKSAHDTKIILEGVMDEINCAMRYIGHFVAPTSVVPIDADLSAAEKNIISEAVATIDNWNVICEHGISIAMENNSDVIYITQASNELKQTTNALRNATSTLRNKLAAFQLY